MSLTRVKIVNLAGHASMDVALASLCSNDANGVARESSTVQKM